MEERVTNLLLITLSKVTTMSAKDRRNILDWALDLLIVGNTEAALELIQLVTKEY